MSTAWKASGNMTSLLHAFMILDVVLTNVFHFSREFQLFCLLRQLFCAIFLLSSESHAMKTWLYSGVIVTSMLTYIGAVVKLLHVSEHSEQLEHARLWISVGWSIGAGFALIFVWRRATCEKCEKAESGRSLSLHQFIWKLLGYSAREWHWFSVGFASITLLAIVRAHIPHYTGLILDSLSDPPTFRHAILVFGGLKILNSVFNSIRLAALTYAAGLVGVRCRRDVFRSLLRQDIAFFDTTTRIGEITSTLCSDVQWITYLLVHNLPTVPRSVMGMAGSLVFMFSISWRLTVVSLILVPIAAIYSWLRAVHVEESSRRQSERVGKESQKIREVLSSMRTIRSFATETLEIDAFRALLNGTLDATWTHIVWFRASWLLFETFYMSLRVAVCGYGGHLAYTNRIDASDVFTFFLHQHAFFNDLYQLAYCVSETAKTVGRCRKVFELMDRRPAFRLDGPREPRVSGGVRLEDITFSYSGRPILEGLSLNIRPGETIAIVGPSGGGKSSLVALIEHFYEPQNGTIRLDGVDVRDIDHEFYHQKIALVAQEPVLYSGTIRENILYGCDENTVTEQEMLEAARMADLEEFVRGLEKGFETMCGDRGVQMSGGQKQRIAIARALIREPHVLILDEATSALDVESERRLQKSLETFTRRRTLILIAHRLSTIRKADRIVVLDRGRIQQIGTHEELMKDPRGVYFSLMTHK